MRPLWQIAMEIKRNWRSPDFSALPYIAAMRQLDTLSDKHGADDAELIVNYFLTNAATWRGSYARNIKKELKDMLREHNKTKKRFRS